MRRASGPIVLLILLPLVCWVWIVALARDMYGPMTGPSAWMMTPVWDGPHLVLLWAMWAVMMTAMMLPSAAPMVLMAGGGARSYGLALGYVAVWGLFSLGVTALQWLFAQLLIINAMMQISSPVAGAILLTVAAAYQFTPLKHACLTTCQSPMAFVARRWRSGSWGAFRMGVEHGVYCVGCCWALMLLLFAGGVMNLVVIVALTAWVAFEKLAPARLAASRIGGVLLFAAAVWMLAS